MAPSFPTSPPIADNSDPERRLREAEERLRDAIEELQRRQRRAAAHAHHLHHNNHLDSPPCDHSPDESCIAHAIGNLCQTFLLSYGVRVGIGILLRAFKLVRRQSYSSLLDLKVSDSSIVKLKINSGLNFPLLLDVYQRHCIFTHIKSSPC